MQVRAARPEDWPAMWLVLSPVLAAGETYTYPRDITEAQARAAWVLDAPWVVRLAVEGDRVVGVAKLGPNLPGQGAHVANASFVVAPGAGGRGVGRGLAEDVLSVARSAGYRAMQFNAVVETNERAVALWSSLGFRVLATVPEAFDHPRYGLVGLHVMHRFL